MKKNVMLIVILAVVLTAALAVAVPAIKDGFASQSQTDNDGNDLSAPVSVKVTPESGRIVQIPSAKYSLDVYGRYAVDQETRSVQGTMTIKTNSEDTFIRIGVTFDDQMSWYLIDSMNIVLKKGAEDWKSYPLFDSTRGAGSGVASDLSDKISVSAGTYSYKITVTFKKTVDMNPGYFDGNNMVSKVIFIIDAKDPLESKKITVHYDGNGSSDVMTDEEVDLSRPYLKKNTFTNSPYSFAGWKYNSTLYTDEADIYSLIVNNTGTITMTAQWGYKISFDANGGTGSMSEQVVIPDNGEYPISGLDANAFLRTGYQFTGWNTRSDGSGSTYTPGSGGNIAITGDLTLYAKWSKATLTVNLYKTTSSGTPTTDTVDIDDYTLVANSFSNSPYTFAGWALTENATTVVIKDEADMRPFIKRTNSTLDLYAVWGYKITFKANGGTGSDYSQIVVPNNGEYPVDGLYTNKFIRDGYTFHSWNTSSGASLPESPATAVTVTGDVTLYALWKVNTYTVTWKFQDGSSTYEVDNDVNYGSSPSFEGATPTKTDTAQYHYEFANWSTSKNAKEGTAVGYLATVSNDITYYAAFSETLRQYTVTWKNGETTLETDENVNYGTIPDYGSAAPTKSDAQYVYTFAGWSTTDGEESGERPGLLPTVSGDVTYYAAFSKTVRQYSVTLQAGSNGSISPTSINNQNYNTGYSVSDNVLTIGANSITATANDRYQFDGWYDGETKLDGSMDNLKITQDITLTAKFTAVS